MTAVQELAYVVYEASDLDEWARFGVELLGMQLESKGEDELRLRTDEKAFRWLVTAGPADDLAASGYLVKDETALEAVISRLQQHGVEVAEGSDSLAASRRVDRIAITQDPMGNRIELVTGFADASTPFESDGLMGTFLTGNGGAGHQVLLSKGVPREEYLRFYEDLLGFKVSDTIVQELAPGVYADLIFLHCNPRHHTVAFGDMPHPKRQHHFMLEVTDIRDVGRAYDRCLRAMQPMEMTLGMHPNDQMFSFYVRTPSGASVEFGWGGLMVDDATWEVQAHDELSSWGHLPPEALHELLGGALQKASDRD